jgi:uncharacterized protein YjbJ (UPF0337 family)
MGQKAELIKGQIKEVAGRVTGDKDLKAEGKADRRAGHAKARLRDAENKIEELIDKVKHARRSK